MFCCPPTHAPRTLPYLGLWKLAPTRPRLDVMQAAHRVVAAAALRRGTGARGLRSLLDSLLRDALYHVCTLNLLTSRNSCIEYNTHFHCTF